MDRKAFFNAVRQEPFDGRLSQGAVDSINAILPAFETYGDGDDRKLAYILATAFHEVDRFRTMEEYASGAAYEGRDDLGNTEPGDGRRFKGRGFVMNTGRRNYADWSERLGLDLIGNPDLVKQPAIAARILVEGMMKGTFTGVGLPKYFTASKADWTNARRVVNGTDRAAMIAGYAKSFLAAIQTARAAETDEIVILDPVPIPTPKPEEAPMPEKPEKELTPPEQMNKPIAGIKGGALAASIGGAVLVLLNGSGWLPDGWQSAEAQGALTVLFTTLPALIVGFWRGYQAPDLRYTQD